MSWKEVVTIAGGFIGVLMIMNPSWFVGSSNELSKRSNQDQKAYPYYWIGIVMTISFAFVASIGVISIRILNRAGSNI